MGDNKIRKTLTPIKIKIMKSIYAHMTSGYRPTIQELGMRVARSKSSVHCHIVWLWQNGFLFREGDGRSVKYILTFKACQIIRYPTWKIQELWEEGEL